MNNVRKVHYRREFSDTFSLLYPELVDERKKLEAEKSVLSCTGLNQYLGLVKTITFVVTEGCTLNCSYCYQVDKDHNAIMSKETAIKAVDMILDDSKMEGYINSKDTPGVIIDFIGGEPLLQVELMDFICDYFRYKADQLNHPWLNNHMINFTSNGTLYMNEKVQRFLKKNSGRLSFTITVDGNEQLHDSCRVFHDGKGSYKVVEEALLNAQAFYSLDSSKITLAPENIMYTFDAVKHLSDLGVHDLNANVVYEDVWVPERDAPIFYDQLIKLADWFIDEDKYIESYLSLFDELIGKPVPDSQDQNWCGGNGQMLSIGTDGNLYPCIRFMDYSLNDKSLPEFLIGNVKDGIEKEEDNKYLSSLASLTRKNQSTDECNTCQVGSGCGWCTGYNYDHFKTPHKRAMFHCWLHKARVLGNYYFWNKLYKKTGQDEVFPLNLTEKEIELITKGDNRWQNF